jgi:hypothetical protein
VVTDVDGFTFDEAPVQTEIQVVNSISDEYLYSFQLGVYGTKTEAKLEEFAQKVEAAGLETIRLNDQPA